MNGLATIICNLRLVVSEVELLRKTATEHLTSFDLRLDDTLEQLKSRSAQMAEWQQLTPTDQRMFELDEASIEAIQMASLLLSTANLALIHLNSALLVLTEASTDPSELESNES